jgi:hypothetical protein
MIEILISAALIAIAAMAAVAYVTRASGHARWAGEKVFARQRALSILAELRSFVETGEGESASDLDGFDDGASYEPSLTIQPDPKDPGAFLAPDSPVSGNHRERDHWEWLRKISVRPFPGVASRDLRICTVRVYRLRTGDKAPGEQMAEASSVIRTSGESFPTTQVYDVYLLACENVPGWWVYMDAIQPFVEAALSDLEGRNPGLKFRTHWITTLGYGRDEEYAPYTNKSRDSEAHTPWAYVYPGAMPPGASSQNYYVADRMRARVNVDGETTPQFANDWAPQESFSDANGNGRRDPGEAFVDANGNGQWDVGNEVPYALADMNNHCMRYPDARAKFQARVAAGLEDENTPTWRLLLDTMILDPERFHNAILINLHGELLPMPPARNYSDAAAAPELRPGWRAVTHPERLAPTRVPGDDAASVAPRFRVYAYKTEFDGAAGLEEYMSQAEPFVDADHDGVYDAGEAFLDWNGNGVRDDEIPITVVIPDGDFSANPNGATNPSLLVERLPGGVDADGDGYLDAYRPFEKAARYPEAFTDTNGDKRRQVAEPWLDLDGDGIKGPAEPHQELDGDGTWTATSESLVDANGNGCYDSDRPAEPFTDANGNGRWDAPEPYWDRNGNGKRDGPTNPTPPAWKPWDPSLYGNTSAEDAYVADYGEPFLDVDGDGTWDAGESFFDANGNGVCDGGFERGEMWYSVQYDAANRRTVLTLHATPLEAEYVAGCGLPAGYRLYDLAYVPCPMPDTAGGTDRFARDLAWNGNRPKNTARWRITLPVPAVRKAFESKVGAADGDAADRIITAETRIGSDLTTGVMWPTRHEPQDLSRTFAYYYADPQKVPFSERYQFLGDPRDCPYADTDATGATAPHGTNWYWDDMSNGSGNYQGRWLAFDGARLRDGWMGRSDHDTPRLMQWLRTALVHNEAIWTTLTGFSYFYLSLGGDIGYDSANGYPDSIPMDGTPFGLAGAVHENTITSSGGTASIIGSRKFVRSNDGTDTTIDAGGYWWSKPWLGELFQDSTYAAQWKGWGNLRAAPGTSPGEYHLVRRSAVTPNQQPVGTSMGNALAITSTEGCVTLFHIGTKSATFHHQYKDGATGTLVDDGPQLAQDYNYALPSTAPISRPWHLDINYDGGVGDEFGYTDVYPRHNAQLVRRYFDHSTRGLVGSGLVRLQEPGPDPRGAYIVVNGIDRTTESGSAFIARYSLITLIHSYFAGGLPGTPDRIGQLPRVAIQQPTLITELESPETIPVTWSTEWKRWDDQKYTLSYPDNFSEPESALFYVPMYSKDNGETWLDMLDDQPVTPGTPPWTAGVGPDPSRTLDDVNPSGDETYTWSTPASKLPEGSYLIRIEAYRRTEALHYAQHQEKIYVSR